VLYSSYFVRTTMTYFAVAFLLSAQIERAHRPTQEKI